MKLLKRLSALTISGLLVATTQASVPKNLAEDSATVLIPAGDFIMGCTEEDQQSEACYLSKPAKPIYLDAYRIDKYKVTFRRFNDCVQNGSCTEPFAGSGCNAGMSWNADHPVNCVDWNQAKALCEYEGKRLVTEAEWEKAARGTDGRTYPWGSEKASCDLTVMSQKVGDNSMGPGCGAGTTMPVGSKPEGASPYGVMGMEGNLFEWTADWFSIEHELADRNPKGPSTGEHKTLKSSSWLVRRSESMASNIRTNYSPLGQGYVVGFRCASSAL